MKLRYYQAADGRQPFVEWLAALADREARARIQARLDVVAAGSFGDVEPVGEGVLELRVHWGPGYRIYFARIGGVVVLLLCGGDKRTQHKDIEDAKSYFNDFKRRTAKPPARGRA
jgi:putative addiction module killer protein